MSNIDNLIDSILTLTPKQLNAFNTFRKTGSLILSGSVASGKTYLNRVIIQYMRLILPKDRSVAVVTSCPILTKRSTTYGLDSSVYVVDIQNTEQLRGRNVGFILFEGVPIFQAVPITRHCKFSSFVYEYPNARTSGDGIIPPEGWESVVL